LQEPGTEQTRTEPIFVRVTWREIHCEPFHYEQ
jgi:hypothetical protein